MTQGFFSKKETESISAVGGEIHSCASCGLYRDCMTAKMKPYGDFEKSIMVIGEAPSMRDDDKGIPWQGREGRLLRQALNKLGINLFKDCISLNAVNCFIGEKRGPTTREINYCRSVMVWKALQKYQPKVILVLGKSPLQSLVGHRWNGGVDISKWRGWTIPDQQIKSWVCPTFDPGYLLHKDKPTEMMNIWLQDIERAIQMTEEKFPRFSKPEIEYVEDLSFLNDYPEQLSAFDYETTGLKPHAKGHRIMTASIANNENHAWAFCIPKTKKGRLPLRKWLANPRIPKMAHNMKYEEHWSREILKVPVRGLEWDSMIAAHVLDNRPGVTGLKFQTYVNFGVIGYEDEVSPYLKSANDKHGDNSKNRIQELMKSKAGIKKVLKYNALDSIYEYRLAVKQIQELDYDFLPF